MSGEPEIIGGFGFVAQGLFATPEHHDDFESDQAEDELLAAGVEIVTFGGPDGSDAFLVISVTKKLVDPWGHEGSKECFARLGADDYPLSVINEWRSRFEPLCSKLGLPFVPENIGWFMCLSWEGT